MGKWAIDSADYSYNQLAAVQQAYGATPAVWGRYLPNDSITPTEVAYLHTRQIAIMALWNGESAATVGWGYGYAYGQARTACGAWGALGLPPGCAILVDVEQPWEVSGAFLQGWLNGCHSLGYVGGAYLNPLSGVNHVTAWLWAREQTSAPGVVYSSEPELTEWRGTVRTDWYDFSQTPIAARAQDVLFHQYSENELSGVVDLDVVSDAGYALCWGAVPPPKPPPPVWRIKPVGGCDLKSKPSHVSDDAIDPKHRPVHLPQGSLVTVLGAPVVTDDAWTAVALPGTREHGYVRQADLERDDV